MFCNYDSPTWKAEHIAYDQDTMGFYSGAELSLSDLEGLLAYLQARSQNTTSVYVVTNSRKTQTVCRRTCVTRATARLL